MHTYGDNWLFVAEFDNKARSSECTHDFGSIKNCAADINQEYWRGPISFEQKSIRFRTMWIPLHDWCISEWGLHIVPLDIRHAITDIQSSLGMSTVLWPAILYRGDDVGLNVIVPNNVDEFGMVVED